MRFCLLCLFCLLLAACAEGSPVPGDLAALNAQATLAVITQQAQETRSASIEATRQAGVESAKLNAEAALISTQAAIRQNDLIAQLTQQALEDNRATEIAAPILATQAAIQTQPAIDATATAIAVASAIEIEKGHREKVLTWAYFAVILAIGIAASISLWNVTSWALEKQRRKSLLIETLQGLAVFDEYSYTWQLLSTERKQIGPGVTQLERAPSVILSPRGVTARSPVDTVRKDVILLLKKAQELNGEDATTIPSDEKIGWSSGRWQYIVGILRDNNLVLTKPSRGTYVTEHKGNVDNILYELETGQIHLKLSPSQKERGRDE
jgi:hypothetical protein